VNSVPDIFRILPEVVLTLTGVLVMLVDATLPPHWARRNLGWVAAFGTTFALWASLWQLLLPEGTGFYGTVETSAFTVFFHVLICGVVLASLLLSLDTLPEDSHHQGEFYALMVFGAVGMCLMTSAIELLLVFIALEISSIATYVLAGYRKETARGPEAAIKYFLLGSFATAFLLYGIALIFGATGTTQIYEIARLAPTAQNHSLLVAGMGLMLVGILFKVSAAPFHVWTPDVYEGAPSPVVALMSTAPKAAAFALLLRVVYEMLPSLRSFWEPLLWVVAVLSMTVGNLAALRQTNVKRMLAYSSIAHAGYLLAAFAGFGTEGIAAASFYVAAYAAMNVGIFAVVTLVSGYDEKLPLIEDFRGLVYRSPLLGGLDSLHRGIFRQVLLVFSSGGRRSHLAGDHRPAEFRPGCRVLSAPGPGRGSAPGGGGFRSFRAAGGRCGGCCVAARGDGDAGSGHCAERCAPRRSSWRGYSESAFRRDRHAWHADGYAAAPLSASVRGEN
jgi:NADH-quinone oxidoreductase subunit N